jgi:WD40 repeat protein
MISECTGFRFGLTSIVFADDGKRLLTSGYDGTARLWDRDTGKELYRFRDHKEFVWSAVFSPDGKWVLTGGGGGTAGEGKWTKGKDHALRLWRMPDEKTLAEFQPGE